MEDISSFSDDQLRMALIEWRRWLDRVYNVKEISRRQERFEEAREYIIAIEREIQLRSAQGCELLRELSSAALLDIARTELVPLERYRAVHEELELINQKIVGHRRTRLTTRS